MNNNPDVSKFIRHDDKLMDQAAGSTVTSTTGFSVAAAPGLAPTGVDRKDRPNKLIADPSPEPGAGSVKSTAGLAAEYDELCSTPHEGEDERDWMRRARDEIVEWHTRDEKQCEILQAALRNDREQFERIAALESALAQANARAKVMKKT